jgi:hypothetical protein
MTVQGNLLTNTITGTTTTSTISLFPNITTTDISLGAGLTTGSTLKIGSSTNSNHLGLIDFTGNTINNIVPLSGSIYICPSQTSGGLYIASGASRTGAINIGNGASSTATISLGSSTSSINLNGTTVSVNSISMIPQAFSYAVSQNLADNTAQNTFVIHTNTATARSLTLPVNPYNGQKITYMNRSPNQNNTLIVGNTGTQTLQGYNVSATSITVYINQVVIVQWIDVARNYWIIQYKSNETYLPITPIYPTITLFTDLSQIGYTYTQTAVQTATTGNGTTTYNMLINAATFPVGLYNVNVRNILTVGTNSNTLNTITSSLSTSTTSVGAIAGFLNTRYPVSVTFIAGFIDQSTASGAYTRSAVGNVYVTLSFVTAAWVTSGVTPTLSCSITRIA